jgi:glycosyltransferase involved in cell wall biosynthesis
LILGAFGCVLHRKPTVWHVHHIVSRDHFGRLHLVLIKWAVKIGVDSLIASSRASADALIELTGLQPSAVLVVHNGVDMARFRGNTVQEAMPMHQRRATLGLPTNAFLVGLFGRFNAWKGQHVALDAIASRTTRSSRSCRRCTLRQNRLCTESKSTRESAWH